MFDIVYAVDCLSSIGSDSVGMDAPSDISVGGSTISSLELHNLATNKTISEFSISMNEDYDDVSSYTGLDVDVLESDLDDDADDNMSQISTFDAVSTDDDLSFVSDDFDLDESFNEVDDGEASESSHYRALQQLTPRVSSIGIKQEAKPILNLDSSFLQSFQSFSDDEDDEASIPTHCAGSQQLASIVSALPCNFPHVLIGVKKEEGKSLRNCDFVRRIDITKPEKEVPRFCSSDVTLRRTFRLPSRSLSLDIKIRL